ncbi:hypothetical protein NJT12_00170 [Flavobacterium sp. AC]|uniref:AAA domain-containing protein n=1 Tax=Flavobacterium azizsancarii TaxID=2961580 RepID=A0ABT4W5Z8_9FLAO|nr:hypothetical protein [Flavobacterium azizsancarii]MDA6068017.1 hypothetical protein [Flavobacterium azizsancarii]
MSEIIITADPSGKDQSDSKKTIIIWTGRQCGKNHMIRNLSQRENIIIVDDIDEPTLKQPELDDFGKNYSKWIEYYFPNYAKPSFPLTTALKKENQVIKLGVKKRYIKAPRIQMVTGRQYFEFHFKVVDKLTKEVMRQKKDIKRPTLKAESIFDAEKRLQQQAKHISNTFVHTKPIKYLLK